MNRANGSVTMKGLKDSFHKLLFGSPGPAVPPATLNTVKARFEAYAAAEIKRCVPARPKDDGAWEILIAEAW